MITLGVLINKDNYTRELYGFTLFNTTLVFDSYIVEVKPKGKRKWKVQNRWERLFQRNNTIPQPELHIGIRNEAMAKLKELLTVKTWDEYKPSKAHA